ncbi:MAG: pyridoxal-phosphate-dependent aminotransferase family protein [Gemmatimonadota bacterium]
MTQPPRLFLPGPTAVAPEVLEAQARRLIGHRGPEITALLESTQTRLRQVFQTGHRVYVSTSSATGLFEAAARSCIKDHALCCVNGAFSQRWAEVTEANGKVLARLEVEWGQPITADQVDEALDKAAADGRPFDAVTVVHNETSTGVTSPVGEIAEAIRARKAKGGEPILLMVDAVSSLGGIDVPVDRWGLDVCLTGGQKCLAMPPGLAFAAVSDRALERAGQIPDRGWYFDFLVYEKYLERWQTPATPAVTLLYAVDVQLDRILEEGLEARFARHRAMAEHVRSWALDRFDILAPEGYRSDSVTAVVNTRGIDVGALNRYLAESADWVISNGYAKLKDKTFRIGHMGDHTVEECKELTRAIDAFLGRPENTLTPLHRQ